MSTIKYMYKTKLYQLQRNKVKYKQKTIITAYSQITNNKLEIRN